MMYGAEVSPIRISSITEAIIDNVRHGNPACSTHCNPSSDSGGATWARLGRIIPFFDYPPEIRHISYTINVIEPVRMSVRKIS
jgi:hypothetical protein